MSTGATGNTSKTQIDLSDVTIKPLDSGMSRAAFCCGISVIDNFFKNNAKRQHEAHRVRVYVASHQNRPIGYYYLVAKSSLPDHVSKEAFDKFGRVKSTPMIYLGMIGVCSEFQGNGLGRLLMLDAMRRTLQVADVVGVYALALDAIDEHISLRYERWGFTRFEEGESAMYIALPTIRLLFT
jgi:GNAT superfamily N-acetyltransferase